MLAEAKNCSFLWC